MNRSRHATSAHLRRCITVMKDNLTTNNNKSYDADTNRYAERNSHDHNTSCLTRDSARSFGESNKQSYDKWQQWSQRHQQQHDGQSKKKMRCTMQSLPKVELKVQDGTVEKEQEKKDSLLMDFVDPVAEEFMKWPAHEPEKALTSSSSLVSLWSPHQKLLCTTTNLEIKSTGGTTNTTSTVATSTATVGSGFAMGCCASSPARVATTPNRRYLNWRSRFQQNKRKFHSPAFSAKIGTFSATQVVTTTPPRGSMLSKNDSQESPSSFNDSLRSWDVDAKTTTCSVSISGLQAKNLLPSKKRHSFYPSVGQAQESFPDDLDIASLSSSLIASERAGSIRESDFKNSAQASHRETAESQRNPSGRQRSGQLERNSTPRNMHPSSSMLPPCDRDWDRREASATAASFKEQADSTTYRQASCHKKQNPHPSFHGIPQKDVVERKQAKVNGGVAEQGSSIDQKWKAIPAISMLSMLRIASMSSASSCSTFVSFHSHDSNHSRTMNGPSDTNNAFTALVRRHSSNSSSSFWQKKPAALPGPRPPPSRKSTDSMEGADLQQSFGEEDYGYHELVDDITRMSTADVFFQVEGASSTAMASNYHSATKRALAGLKTRSPSNSPPATSPTLLAQLSSSIIREQEAIWKKIQDRIQEEREQEQQRSRVPPASAGSNAGRPSKPALSSERNAQRTHYAPERCLSREAAASTLVDLPFQASNRVPPTTVSSNDKAQRQQEHQRNREPPTSTCSNAAGYQSNPFSSSERNPQRTHYAPERCLSREAAASTKVALPMRASSRVPPTATASSSAKGNTVPRGDFNTPLPPPMLIEGKQIEILPSSRIQDLLDNAGRCVGGNRSLLVLVQCIGCNTAMIAAKDMVMIYCPTCHTLSRLDLCMTQQILK